MPNLRHSALALTGAAVLTTLLTACGGGASGASGVAPQSESGTAAPAPGDSAGPTTSTGNGPGSGSGSGSGSASRTSATAPAQASGGSATTATGTRCTSSQLKATVGDNDPGAGQENFPVVLTNVSGRTCTVYGFPGLQFQDTSRKAVTPDPQRSGGSKAVVKLAPGASAWAPMSFSNPEVSGATSVTPAWLVVTPPDETHSFTVKWSGGPVPSGGNASTITIGTFSAGTGV